MKNEFPNIDPQQHYLWSSIVERSHIRALFEFSFQKTLQWFHRIRIELGLSIEDEILRNTYRALKCSLLPKLLFPLNILFDVPFLRLSMYH